MKKLKARFALGLVLAGLSIVPVHGQETATATCAAQTFRDQCRVGWNFARPSSAFYWVQQLNPMSGAWQHLSAHPDGTIAQGSRNAPVEAGYLYRVLACDDDRATINCTGSTMVWAPLIQPPERLDLIPSLVPATNPQRGVKGYIGGVSKNAPWLAQVAQYNSYQLVNAISYANIAELPNMTPARDIRVMPPAEVTPIDTVQFNVWETFIGEQGTPLEEPTPEPSPRPPHEHPERHQQ